MDIGNVEINGVDEKGTKVRRMLEVDFVCNQGYKRCYIQSALSLPDKEKTKQELASLLRIDDSFMKYVITGDLIKKYQTMTASYLWTYLISCWIKILYDNL